MHVILPVHNAILVFPIHVLMMVLFVAQDIHIVYGMPAETIAEAVLRKFGPAPVVRLLHVHRETCVLVNGGMFCPITHALGTVVNVAMTSILKFVILLIIAPEKLYMRLA